MYIKKQSKIAFIVFIALISIITMPGHAATRRMAVKVPVANIRSGAGTGFPTLWRVEKYTPINVIRESKGWYFFSDFEGSRGWIKKSLVGKLDTVVTRKKLCNIRTGPGTNFDIAFQTEKGVPFKVLERKGKWLEILHSDGDRGWVHKSLVW